MGTASKRRKPNERLRYQRHLHCWTLRDVADKLYDLCASEEQRESGMSADTVGRWELGVSKPSLFYQQKLCALFGQSAAELGLIEPLPPPQERLPAVASRRQQVAPVPLPSSSQPIDLLAEVSGLAPEELLGAWLAAGAADLSALCAEGWTLEEVLSSLQVVLKGVQAMPNVSRRRLLQLGAAAAIRGVPIPEGKHLSAEERIRLHSALGESIAAGWKLFHTSSMPQVLAVGQAQLFLVQQASSNLDPSVRAICYSSIYNLIGAALHFQGYYDESYQAHERAHLAALEGGDVLNMAQSRACQANVLREQERHIEALQTIEAALRLISQQSNTESIRLRAHLLAAGAESAAFLGETEIVQKNLSASEALLEQLPYVHIEEFDHASWHQYVGTCALILKRYDHSVEELQRAIDTLPPQWLVRHATALMPLAIAYARKRERDRCFETLKKVAQVVKAINASSLNEQFVKYLGQEILGSFHGDAQISAFVTDARQQLIASYASVHVN
jgi:tetratricopeptide (TPR) repeat protein